MPATQTVQRMQPNQQLRPVQWAGGGQGRSKELALVRGDELQGNGCRTTGWVEEVELRERLWQSVFDEPSAWIDFRPAKRRRDAGRGHADFTHGASGEAVWLDSFFLPPWVPEKLAAADGAGAPGWRPVTRDVLQAELWQRLFDEPQGWLDYRPLKEAGQLEPLHPDFTTKTQQLSLSDDHVPEWAPAALKAADEEIVPKWRIAGGPLDGLCTSLFQQPDKWLDFRAAKAKGAIVAVHPDFRQLQTGEGIWMDQMPNWAAVRLRLADKEDPPRWADPAAAQP